MTTHSRTVPACRRARQPRGRKACVGRRRRGAAAFGLVEVVVSAGIGAVVLLGFAANTIGVARARSASGNVAAATALAEQRLEALRNLPLDAGALSPGTHEDPASPMGADGAPGSLFSRGWVVSGPDTPAPGLKEVTVTVAWSDHGDHRVSLSAYVRCSTVPCS